MVTQQRDYTNMIKQVECCDTRIMKTKNSFSTCTVFL